MMQVSMMVASPLVTSQHIVMQQAQRQSTQAAVFADNMQIKMAHHLRKRHNSLQDILLKQMNTPFALDWSNPCGGLWLGNKSTRKQTKQHKTRFAKSLRNIKKAALREHRVLAVTTSIININDIRDWELHKKQYEFLPSIRPDSNITLRSWHRQLQVFAAAFGYLHRLSLYSDQSHIMYESEVSKVLGQMKLSARNVLCEIESAINATINTTQKQQKQQNQHKPHIVLNIKAQVMLERMHFQTPFKGQLNALNGIIELERSNASHIQLNLIDLKFAKQRYFKFLRGIINVLKNHRRLRKRKKTRANIIL